MHANSLAPFVSSGTVASPVLLLSMVGSGHIFSVSASAFLPSPPPLTNSLRSDEWIKLILFISVLRPVQDLHMSSIFPAYIDCSSFASFLVVASRFSSRDLHFSDTNIAHKDRLAHKDTCLDTSLLREHEKIVFSIGLFATLSKAHSLLFGRNISVLPASIAPSAVILAPFAKEQRQHRVIIMSETIFLILICVVLILINGIRHVVLLLCNHFGLADSNYHFNVVSEFFLYESRSRLRAVCDLEISSLLIDDYYFLHFGPAAVVAPELDAVGADFTRYLVGLTSVSVSTDVCASSFQMAGAFFVCESMMIRITPKEFSTLLLFLVIAPESPSMGDKFAIKSCQQLGSVAIYYATFLSAGLPYSRGFHAVTAKYSPSALMACCTTRVIGDFFFFFFYGGFYYYYLLLIAHG